MRRPLPLIAALTLTAATALAEPPAAPSPADDSGERALYKSISYQAVSSVDDFLFGYFLGGGATAGAILVAANAATEIATNYAHDRAWALVVGDNPEAEDRTRAARTLTYTGINTFRTYALGHAMTGDPMTSIVYVTVNAAADAAAYAANDAAWAALWPAGTQPGGVKPEGTKPAAPDTAPAQDTPTAWLPRVNLVTRAVDPAERDPFTDLFRPGGGLIPLPDPRTAAR